MKKYIVSTVCLLVSAVSGWGFTVTASSGDRAASADLSFGAGVLTVVLTNTSSADVLNPTRILTALFFNYTGPALSEASAVLSGGSSVFFDTAPAGGVVGGEWAYGGSLSGAPGGRNAGISSAGFGVFGSATFPGADLDPPAALNGLNYGITSAGDNIATGNAAVTGNVPLIKNSVTFTFGYSGTLLASSFSNFRFQYGTALDEGNICAAPCLPADEPGVPEPSFYGVLAGGLSALFYVTHRARSHRNNTNQEVANS